MTKERKNLDEVKIAEILSNLVDRPKHFNEIFNQLKNNRIIHSKTTLSKYLNYLVEEKRVVKIVSPVKGRRTAYEIASDEDRQLAEQAKQRKEAEQRRGSLYETESASPTQNPLNPSSIKENIKPKPAPLEFLTKKMSGIVCTILEELQLQLQMYEQIKDQPRRDEVWIESSFDRLEQTLRERLSTITHTQNADHYTHEELMNAAKTLHNEYLDKSKIRS
jgi:DNA-binding HxlR family transcriptional regulator